MNKTIIAVCLTILAAAWIIRPHTTLAQSKSFAGVYPFVTASGLFGLFNQSDGKIYIYNNNLSECIYKGQAGDLGEPIAKIGGKEETTTYSMPQVNK